mmetsp:Transcript_6345/g.18584  ORF Transcript_6345/g.18584 Transcript_6345/m.18584 type:complete len:414 (-) Transcript_6345:178-1419(-)
MASLERAGMEAEKSDEVPPEVAGDMKMHVLTNGQQIGRVAVPNDTSLVMKGGNAAKAADFANYFCSYAYLYHQKQMLTDHHRMSSYHQAIMRNRVLFEGKTVVDVGTGSGILAAWSAQAGAGQVWAVEYTDMAKHAVSVMKHNGVDDRVHVVKGAIEELDLPAGSVDVIISEWMGYFLLRESMLDSVIRGRDRLLKPGGAMFPSHATMVWAAITCEDERLRKVQDCGEAMVDWRAFTDETAEQYGVSMKCLDEAYAKEQRDYYSLSSMWYELGADQIVGEPVVVKELNMHTCTVEQVQGVEHAPFAFQADAPSTVSGFAGWFDTDFAGSEQNPCPERVVLSTHPRIGYTHWGQQVFFLEEAIELNPGDVLSGSMSMRRQKTSARLYDVIVSFQVRTAGAEEEPTMTTLTYEMP